ncbi:deoxyribodipyrimidine photolyase family protein [Bacillus freudenreichii]|nr:deoxyribodipyrimidine photolyase family protein [Bacillus freudenreichii]
MNEDIYTETIDNLPLLCSNTWHIKLHNHWQPGETVAIKRWNKFLKTSLIEYKDGRDFPGDEAVSKLSPHITFGEISVRGIWHAIERNRVFSENPKLHSSMDAFQKQLVWRDFSYHQLFHFPSIRTKPLRQPFEHFPWHTDAASLTNWMRGQTGYPIVDAGMRQLWETGWVHNRVRMIVASFLTKHLLIAWQEGERWFSNTLVDFDMANNAMGWQWSAGSGNDAAPYFRIFNPILQGKKFDKNGEYVRKWIPELRLLPSTYIHEPWTAPKHILDAAQVRLGENYPFPLVDHSVARQRALEAYQQIK